MTCIRIPNGVVCMTPDFKPGDLPPEGYLAWHEWAEVQWKAGIRQQACGRCGQWKTPQELSKLVYRVEAKIKKRWVKVETPVCLKCATGEQHDSR
jgi:hypothetical protein